MGPDKYSAEKRCWRRGNRNKTNEAEVESENTKKLKENIGN